MSDEKKRVNIEDLPVPLKELDKEEEENVAGGLTGAINPTSPTLTPASPTLSPSPLNPRNPDLTDPKNPTFNK